MSAHDSNARFAFFFPAARVLSEAEIEGISPEKKQAAEKAGARGTWLEIDCPDKSCVSSDGKITIPAVGSGAGSQKGVWLNLFCPEDSCELTAGTDLP